MGFWRKDIGRNTFLLVFAIGSSLCAAGPTLDVQLGPNPGSISLSGNGSADGSHRLELSYGLRDWWPVFAIRDTPQWSWDWDEVRDLQRAFFRLVDEPPSAIDPHSSWKTEITLPDDEFFSEPLGGVGPMPDAIEVRWVKFALIIDGLPQVIFQKSADYPFHFHFATERLSPFLGMDLDTFSGVSLFRIGQEVVLGAVLWAPDRNEYGIQLVGQDEFPREMVRFLYETVDGQLIKPPESVGFYMPTFKQTEAAERDRAYLAEHGIKVSSTERWIGGSVCYSPGWAMGRLVFVTADEIEDAHARGDILPTDILLTDGVPAEVPFMAGIISLAPTTPNSHVAILAQSYGVPFVYIREPAEQERVRKLAASEVILRTRGFSCEQIDIFEVQDLDPVFRAEILALKEPLPIEITPMADFGAIWMASLQDAVPEDIKYIGGKAANFGFLRRAIPNNSPWEAGAFSFDLWKTYLDQPVTGGGTLREEIDGRLAGLSWPTDIPALDARLKDIRDLIEDETDFTPTQEASILEVLAGFDAHRKIRFRSSTNVEDSGVFVGAGLYDSFSGCIADDTDGDEIGPSHCDPTKTNERGIFRAMRKVYASFYNINAYIERLRHDVDESEVGMAILVHYSFPDEYEAANGVATSRLSGENRLYTTMVSQVGAESVTNPSGGSMPEIVEANAFRPQPTATLSLLQRSNRLLLGEDTVMQWEDDYQEFSGMFLALVDAYKAHFSDIGQFTLEFEYKKLTDANLVVKQVREVPEAEGRPAPGVALVKSPVHLKVFQGEAGTVFGNHRLKSLWQLESDSRWVDPVDPVATLITSAGLEFAPQGSVVMRSGAPSAWPNAVFDTVIQSTSLFARDRWNWSSDGGDTTYELWFQMPSGTGYQSDPLYSVGDFGSTFNARYEIPVPDIEFLGEPTTTDHELAVLTPGSPDDSLQTGSIRVERSHTSKDQVSIETTFYWPPPPTGPMVGYTAPLEKWVGTTISGLTAQPIELTGYFSQTYRPGHHNATEEFLFEPGLEPGFPAALLAELQAKNVRMIYLSIAGGPLNVIKAVGFDGTIRDL